MINRKVILSFLILSLVFSSILIADGADSNHCNFTVTMNSSDIPSEPEPEPESNSGGGGVGAGRITAITGGGVAAVAALGLSTASFFSGLTPGVVTGLASSIGPVICKKQHIDSVMSNPELNKYLIKGINHINNTLSNLKKANTIAIYVQDQVIMPNSYNITFINVPNNVNLFKMEILQSSSPTSVMDPSLDFRVFKNTNRKELDKIFKTKRFKNPFIKNKEIALILRENLYNEGLISKAIKMKTGTFSQIAIVTTNTFPKGTTPLRYAYIITFDGIIDE